MNDDYRNKSIAGKRFLFVTYRFYPVSDAVSVVVYNVARELITRGAIVSVLYITHRRVSDTEYDGIMLKPIYIPEMKNLKTLFQELKSHPFETLNLAFQKIVGQAINFLPKYREMSVEYIHLKEYKKRLEKEYTNNRHDYYIATLSPTEAPMAFMQIKKEDRNRNFAVYQLDTFWNNATLSTHFQENRLKFEKKLLEKCLFDITTEQVIETTERYHGENSKKLIKSEFPMIKKPKHNETLSKDGTIRCVFTGTLYQNIRPPHNIVRIISEISDEKIRFDFYGFHQELIAKDELYSQAKKHIKLFGVVKTEKAETARLTADFLVNIDNTCLEQVPSKIFEYISTGKPIINFYYNRDSSILKYLSNYPLCVNIYIGEDFECNEACKALKKFIQNTYGNMISYEKISSSYKKNTPAYVTDQIICAFGEI